MSQCEEFYALHFDGTYSKIVEKGYFYMCSMISTKREVSATLQSNAAYKDSKGISIRNNSKTILNSFCHECPCRYAMGWNSFCSCISYRFNSFLKFFFSILIPLHINKKTRQTIREHLAFVAIDAWNGGIWLNWEEL